MRLAPRLLELLLVIRELWLYLLNNGLWRSLVKGLAVYVAGRQRWYLTWEDLTAYAGRTVDAPGFQFRRAQVADLPRMKPFMERMPEAVLRRWCEPGYFFFVTWKGDEAVSYRCLSTYVHPGVEGFVRLTPSQLFMVDEYTVPRYRRRGITRQMVYAMSPWMEAEGFTEVLGVHRTDNYDTIAASRAKGVPRLGTITRSRLLWVTRVSFEPDSSEPMSGGATVSSPVHFAADRSHRVV
ncbi:MAG: GNAT family N-acetyltransferase [Gammaproteobacteria bacterium]